MTATASTRPSPRPSWEANPVVYGLIKWILGTLMRLFYRYEATGMERFPRSGPVMIVTNHLHLFDPGAVVPVVPRQIVTLAAAKWRKNVLVRALLRSTGVIFVRRGEVDRTALRACLQVLRNGGVLAIAPEGTRSLVGTLQRAKGGAAYLAVRTDVTVVPIAFWGTEQLHEWKCLKRPTCRVIVGQSFRLPKPSRKPSGAELQELADLVMVQIGLLLPARYRGVYAERIAATEAGESTGLSVIPVD